MPLIPTFADFCRNAGWSPATIDSPPDVRWAIYDQAVGQHVAQIMEDLSGSDLAGGILHVLSEDVIGSHLGEDWYLRHVTGSDTSRIAKTYLRLNPDHHRVVRLLSQHRTHELARRLYEFQSFDWFPGVVEGLTTRELSGASFELNVLRLLHLASGPVTVKVPTGEKGADFDFSTVVVGRNVPFEAKAKDDTTTFTSKTLIRTVKGAATQFPKGEQGILFMRIPTGWVGSRLEDSYVDALADGSRQTSRIGAVISWIDKPLLRSPDSSFGHVTTHLHYFKHPDCNAALWDFCLTLKGLWEADLFLLAPDAPF